MPEFEDFGQGDLPSYAGRTGGEYRSEVMRILMFDYGWTLLPARNYARKFDLKRYGRLTPKQAVMQDSNSWETNV